MNDKEPRTTEKIFLNMHRELRAWNRSVPESPERLDPIMRVLLQLYANQLAQIEKGIDTIWENAANSLIRAVCPESRRWPVPAYTVMRCKPIDPVVDVDPHTRFFYKEKREGGQTFFFSSLRLEKLISAEVKYIFLRAGNSVINLSPMTGKESIPSRRQQVTLPSRDAGKIYIAIDYSGRPAYFSRANIFLKGIPDVLKQLRWAHWYPGSNFGRFYEDCGFCPGLSDDFSQIFKIDDRQIDWGGLRTGMDLFKALEDNFVIIPEKFASTWELGPIDEELAEVLSSAGQEFGDTGKYYWIRIDLPQGGDKLKLQSPFEIYFNCFIAVNKNELTLFKHTGGNRLVEVEIPEDIDNILEIIKVIDSGGREFLPRYMVQIESKQKSYSLEERGNKLVLWFDFSHDIELPPDSITINYSVTAGTSANGIEAGRISELYESHPGVTAAENIVSVTGAIPAKTESQIVGEVSARLRSRDRALSFAEISNWAMTYDPRILRVECRNGVVRGEKGVHRCIVVYVSVKGESFFSQDEMALLERRLTSFLKSRAPVNAHFKVEIGRE
jgi:hypothetical protein